MFDISDIQLHFNLNVIFLLLAAVFAIVFSLIVYRRTVPPVSTGNRLLLVALRSLAVILLIFILFEPILSILRKSNKKPVVAVVVDNSKSMTIKDRAGDRESQLKSILRSDGLQDISKTADVRYARFSDKFDFAPWLTSDSLKLNGNGTDIAHAIRQIKASAVDENIQAVVLLTDGDYNLGQNPIYEAETLGKPIYTVGLGDSSEQKDLLISKVLTNEIAYVDSRVPVDIVVKSSGFSSERVAVALRESGQTVDEQFIVLKSGTNEYPVQLHFVPKEEGIQKYSAIVSGLPGELTEKNNQRSLFVKVLKSKIKVLLFAGAPSSDVSFIRQSIDNDKNLELQTFVQKYGSEFYEGNFSPSALKDCDCLFLVGFPIANTPQQVVDAIKNAAEESGKPVFLVLSRKSDLNRLKSLESILPFVIAQIRGEEISAFVQISPAQRTHPAVRLSNGSAWDKLPPIYKTESILRPKPESDIVGLMKINNITFSEPMLLTRNLNKHKSIAVLGYGIWRWKLLTEGLSGGTEGVFQSFISNSIRWLTTREEEKQVHVATVKEIYNSGERVEFIGQVYDEKYEPLDNAELRIKVKRAEGESETVLAAVGSGRYEGAIEGLPEGDYHFSATAVAGGRTLGESKGRFSIGEANMEFQDTRMNAALLQQISYRSGGRFCTPSTFSQLCGDLKANPNLVVRAVTQKSEFQLWNRKYLLGVIVLLLALEWFLRKRSGMM
jgi:hypothetical protein